MGRVLDVRQKNKILQVCLNGQKLRQWLIVQHQNCLDFYKFDPLQKQQFSCDLTATKNDYSYTTVWHWWKSVFFFFFAFTICDSISPCSNSWFYFSLHCTFRQRSADKVKVSFPFTFYEERLVKGCDNDPLQMHEVKENLPKVLLNNISQASKEFINKQLWTRNCSTGVPLLQIKLNKQDRVEYIFSNCTHHTKI